MSVMIVLQPRTPPHGRGRVREGFQAAIWIHALCVLTGLLVCLLPRSAAAEEFIYLGSGPILGDRARQIRVPIAPPAGAALAPAPAPAKGPGLGWQSPEFPEGSWESKEPTPDLGQSCAGTLYVRRRFDVGPEYTRLSSLALRLKYEDGFAAYLNGVEVARRRLPAATLTDSQTLATEPRPSEQETYYIPVSRGILRQKDNLLALEVHPRTVERCPKVDLELSASDGARVVRGPYIEQLGESAIDIAVESDVPTSITVRYGKGPVAADKDRRIEDRKPTTMHRVRITGLRAATTYHYQMSLRLPTGSLTDLPEASFHTPPRPGRPLHMVVYGDSRSGHDVHTQVVRSILAEDPDLVLVTGDVVERGTEEGDWDRFFKVAAPLLRQVPLYMVAGNHEYARKGQGAQRLFDLFATMLAPVPKRPEGARLPSGLLAVPALSSADPTEKPERGYYSFDTAGVHFVALDSNQFRNVRQQRWLEEDLARASASRPRAIVVWAHEGPYSAGWHGDNSEAIRTYVPILERYNVAVYFSGHDHDYERGHRGRLHYVVTGGGGAELRPLKCGGPDRRRCKNPPQEFINDHHYVRVDIHPGQMKLCPRKIDGSPLSPCHFIRLPH